MALSAMCRNIESSQEQDVILEPTLSLLRNILPVQPPPLLMPSDSTSSPLKSTRLSGHLIACFVVGGECRLCLPQLLAMVLPNFSDSVIQAIYSELEIHSSLATPSQIQSLKISGVLPPDINSCSLIRKTDAERLVSRLLPKIGGKLSDPGLRSKGIPVYHDGFGGVCIGLLIPSLIVDDTSAAIECDECKFLFSGENFVSHSHKTDSYCQWGFDTANWRSYISLSEEVENDEDAQQKLQLYMEYKELENPKKFSTLLSSQFRAFKRRYDSKLENSDASTSKQTKMSKTMPEMLLNNEDEARKHLQFLSNNPPFGQLPPLSFQNLQLLLAYQNNGVHFPLLTLPQQLAKLSTLSSTSLAEPSTSGPNLNSKLLNSIHPIGTSEPRKVESSWNSDSSPLDKLLEDHLSVNVYAVARSFLEEERTAEKQKRQQLEVQVEQLRIVVEQQRRENFLYQNIFAGHGFQDVRNLTAKTAIF